ncbi:VPLPA-CTERM sorting domain-containing protein [Roseibium sp. HPY-6]|uniref:VPLPA-CTERM sorting domain-containing protein n=1 Tax=Roseibium sp. HPY-6 TaxID=3229852 RepID=UPI00338D86D4
MFGHARTALAAALLFASSAAASALPVTADWQTVGGGGFDNGYATTITFDKNAARGTTNDRDNAANALGSADSDFFEIGFGSYVDLTFGTLFDTSVKLFEITFGTVTNWPESAEIFVGDGVSFTSIGMISNADAQGGGILPILLDGTFDTVRIKDTSPDQGRLTGGFDIDAVRVTPVPLPAGALLLATGLGGLALLRRRRRQA